MNIQERLCDWLENIPLIKRIALLGSVVCLISLGFYILVAQSQVQQIVRLRQDISQLDRDLHVQGKKAARLQEMVVRNRQWQLAWQEQKPFLSKESEITFLLGQISDLARRMDLNVTFWKPGEPSHDSSQLVVRIPVTVQVEGGYHTVVMFLDRIRSLPKLLNVTDLRITAPQVRGSQAPIQTTFELVGLVSPEAMRGEAI